VRETLAAFYNSATYKNLQNYKDYKNEYEIFVRNSNYILYGIIDKVIFDSDSKLIVVDYKTDTLPNTDKSSIYKEEGSIQISLCFMHIFLTQ
jgi:ATP-dependent exoDNAse (exonuclease V) beta subunit